MAVMTSGAMLMKSLMLAGAGALCIGLAQVISHPWFDRIFGTCVGVAVIGAGFYLWKERQDGIAKEAFKRTVKALEGAEVVHDAAGNKTALGVELEAALDDAHKKLVKGIQKSEAIAEAKKL